MKKDPEFKPIAGTTACIYCRKPFGDSAGGEIVNITARNNGPRIGQAHADCAALAAGLGPTVTKASPARKLPG